MKTLTLVLKNCYKNSVLFISSLAIFACTAEPPKLIQTSTFFDVTGSNNSSLKTLNSQDFINFLDLESNSNNAVEYRQFFITESFVNPVHRLSIDSPPPKLLSNEFDRAQEIKEFQLKLDESLGVVFNDNKGRKYSSIYVPFVTEINRMARKKGDSNTICLISDLIENSDYLSFYDDDFVEALKVSPDLIEDLFQEELSLANDLTGITVYRIHQPDESDNTLYKQLSRLYRSMLEKRGATVFVQANLIQI